MRITGLATVVVAAVAGGLVLPPGAPRAPPPTETTTPPTTETVAVERRDLVRRETVAGTLTYGSRSELKGDGGTITAPGRRDGHRSRHRPLGRGRPGRADPAVRRPAALAPAVDRLDDGPDIRQLEENLVAMGLADRRG